MVYPPSSQPRLVPPQVPFHLVSMRSLEVRLSFVGPRTIVLWHIPSAVSPPWGRRDYIS